MPTHDEERKGQTKPLRSLCFTYLEISLFILEKHLLPCQFIADTHRSRIATRIDWSNIQFFDIVRCGSRIAKSEVK